MKSTYTELRDLFKLRKSDFRTIKLGLKNKVVSLDADGQVDVQDKVLKNYLREYRKNGVLDIADLVNDYDLTYNAVNNLIKNGSISYFKLHSSKGSKYLFLKSDIEKQNLLELSHVTKIPIHNGNKLLENIIQIMVSHQAIKNNYGLILLQNYSFKTPINSIADKMEISPNYAIRIRNTAEKMLISNLSNILDYKSRNENYQLKYTELLETFKKLQKRFDQITDQHISFDNESDDIFNTPIDKIDWFNNHHRIMIALKGIPVITLNDVINLDKNYLLKMRNFGTTSLKQLEDFLLEEYGKKLKE